MSTMADLHMLSGLQHLLQQLEAAQGGEDPEARARLDQLRLQLAALEQAKDRAAAADAASAATSSAAPAAAVAIAAGASGPAVDAAVLQHIDGLEARLQGLEQKLATLDEGSRVLLVQSAAGWPGELQGGGEGAVEAGQGPAGAGSSGAGGPAGA